MKIMDHNIPKYQDRRLIDDSVPDFRYHRHWRSLLFCRILLLCGTLLACGCSLHKVTLPEVMTAEPTRDEIIAAVNNNSDKIETLVSNDGTLGVSSTPWTAKCRLAYQRETKIRLTGSLNMVGPVIDFGSDGDNFWFWYKNQEPNQISYCRLDEYAKSAFKDQIPVDPIWFPEAIGVVKMESSEIVEGPVRDRDDTIKIVVKKSRPEGEYLKYVYLEPKTAAIKRQDIKNPITDEILTVSCDEFQYNKEKGVVLPKKITISRSMAKERIYIDLGTLQVNSGEAELAQSFRMPRPEELGSTLVNIGPNGGSAPPQVAPEIPPQSGVTPPSVTANQTSSPADEKFENTPPSVASVTASDQAAWGTGDSSYVNKRSIYASDNAAGREIPSRGESDAAEIASSESSASVRFETIVPPDENRFSGKNQGFYQPSL